MMTSLRLLTVALGALTLAACSRTSDPDTPPTHDSPAGAASAVPHAAHPKRGDEQARGTAATATATTTATATATATAASGSLAGCGTHGPGTVWRLKGTIGGKPAQGDAIRINNTLHLAVASEGDFSPVLTGAIDAQGNFDLQVRGGAITSIKGQLDAQGKLTATAQRKGKAAPVAMAGTAESPGAQPRLVSGYSAITATDGKPSVDRPVVEASTSFAIVLLESPGLVSVVARDTGTQGGACDPGRVRSEFDGSAPNRAALTAAATRLVAGAKVLASEVFDEGCSRTDRSLRVVMLVDRQGQREVVVARIPSDSSATAELLNRQPYPPTTCR